MKLPVWSPFPSGFLPLEITFSFLAPFADSLLIHPGLTKATEMVGE